MSCYVTLNACRSGYVEAQNQPGKSEIKGQAHAFGSLAQEVLNAGVPAVIAMRYKIYIDTATKFIENLYSALTEGISLGEAVNIGRKRMAENPHRKIGFISRKLQDWPVPVVYETKPFSIFKNRKESAIKEHKIQTKEYEIIKKIGKSEFTIIDDVLPSKLDIEFIGRDEILLDIDNAFSSNRIILLNGFHGIGKRSIATEFARWYKKTNGINGPILYTCFEKKNLLTDFLEIVLKTFNLILEKEGLNWKSLDNENRKKAVLRLLKQYPVLWIWDRVECINRFPSSTESIYSQKEKQQLTDFLQDITQKTESKFLLTSVCEEKELFKDLKVLRLFIYPMPMLERYQFAEVLAKKLGWSINNMENWRSFLESTRGNPSWIKVLVNKAFQERLEKKEDIKNFLYKLNLGDIELKDKSGVIDSTYYGIEKIFSENECKQIALLHLFQGWVDIEAFCAMGNPEFGFCIPEIKSITRKETILLFEKMVKLGILTKFQERYYIIHYPPWFLKNLFNRYYFEIQTKTIESQIVNPQSPIRAFVEVISSLGNLYHIKYYQGEEWILYPLSVEEFNLLHARKMVLQYLRNNNYSIKEYCELLGSLTKAMQGLFVLYNTVGRRLEWNKLVEEIVPFFVDKTTNFPHPGCEKYWNFITQYRFRIAFEERNFIEAERIQQYCVDWNRQYAINALKNPKEKLDPLEANNIRALATSLHQLGDLQRELGIPKCIASYQEAISLNQHIGDTIFESIAALNLGLAYKDVKSVRDLGQAEHWLWHSLNLRPEEDELEKGRCLGQLSIIAYERFKDALKQKKSEKELKGHANLVIKLCKEALDLTPEYAFDNLAGIYHQLGHISDDIGNIHDALLYYNESIRCKEATNDIYGASIIRYNVAQVLTNAGRLLDALDYAHIALFNFESNFSDTAVEFITNLKKLIKQINQKLEIVQS